MEVLSMSYAWDSTGSVPPHCWGADFRAGVATFTKDIGVWSFKKGDFIPDGLSMVRNTENLPKDEVVGRVWLSSICDLIWISTIHKLGIPPSSSTCCDDTRFCALLIWLGGQGVSWNGGRDYRWFQFKYPIGGNRVFIKPGSHRWVFLKSFGCQKKNTRFPRVKVPQKSPFDLDNWWFFSESKDSSPSKRSTMEVTILHFQWWKPWHNKFIGVFHHSKIFRVFYPISMW